MIDFNNRKLLVLIAYTWVHDNTTALFVVSFNFKLDFYTFLIGYILSQRYISTIIILVYFVQKFIWFGTDAKICKNFEKIKTLNSVWKNGFMLPIFRFLVSFFFSYQYSIGCTASVRSIFMWLVGINFVSFCL